MNREAVVNASPLIFLSRGGHLDLLQSMGTRVLVPNAVFKELSARGPEDPTVRCVRQAEWLDVVEPEVMPPSVVSWGLGAGESAVLALALTGTGRLAVLDDMAGRRCAAALGIPVKGTMGVVLQAKRKGLIVAARPVLEDLVRGGMYLSRSVLDQALSLVDE